MRTRATLYLFVPLVVFACPCVASGQMVRGTVTDATTGTPIKAANLSLNTSDGRVLLRAASDEDGKFEMVLPKGITVYIEASRIGYAKLKSDPVTATTAELLELNVRMAASPIPLEGITVATRRPVDPRLQEFVERASLYKRAGIGRIWTRKEIEERHPALVSHIVDDWVPPRKPVNCSRMRMFIDNMPVEYNTDVDLLVAPDQLEGVEIYNDINTPPDILNKALAIRDGPGGASTLPPCKIVMIWRKPYGELNADVTAPRPKPWHIIAAAALLIGLLLTEQALIRW